MDLDISKWALIFVVKNAIKIIAISKIKKRII